MQEFQRMSFILWAIVPAG